MRQVVNVHEAKTNLSRLLDRAAAGEEIIIARNGSPVARLAPLRPERKARRPGLLAGKIEIAEDFDADLPADLVAAFYDRPIEPETPR